jgi:hypothetical protein
VNLQVFRLTRRASVRRAVLIEPIVTGITLVNQFLKSDLGPKEGEFLFLVVDRHVPPSFNRF